MRLGIDASNLRAGGGRRHLVDVLAVADPTRWGFSEVVLWGSGETLEAVGDQPWLLKSHQPLLDRSLPFRSYWQRYQLSSRARAQACNVVWVPGGSYAGEFRPVVTMSRNMLPFVPRELRRYGWSPVGIRLRLLRSIQARTFREADGLIFLTRYAQLTISPQVRPLRGLVATIPHGVDRSFSAEPRSQMRIEEYSHERPFRILYVSIIDQYKHQWHVAEAVGRLRQAGVPVALDLVGPAYRPALNRLQRTLNRVDPHHQFVVYHGPVPYAALRDFYRRADLCLFASSCENMPNILLEGMSSGLPIVSSNRGPMPEVLGDTGLYFDPEDVSDIERRLRELIASPELRAALSTASHARVREFCWERCANETFEFLAEVARSGNSGRPSMPIA